MHDGPLAIRTPASRCTCRRCSYSNAHATGRRPPLRTASRATTAKLCRAAERLGARRPRARHAPAQQPQHSDPQRSIFANRSRKGPALFAHQCAQSCLLANPSREARVTGRHSPSRTCPGRTCRMVSASWSSPRSTSLDGKLRDVARRTPRTSDTRQSPRASGCGRGHSPAQVTPEPDLGTERTARGVDDDVASRRRHDR